MSTTKSFIAMAIVAILIFFWGVKKREGENPQPQHTSRSVRSGDVITINVTSADWAWVEVGGRHYDSDVPTINGVPQMNLRYWIVANDPKNIPVIMPSNGQTGLVNIGNDVQRVYFRILPGQGITNAQIAVRFK